MQNHIQKNYRKNNSTLNILFEDSDIIVCEKPHGTATQSRRIGSPDMVNLIKRHIYETSSDKSEPYLAVIHRLDQPVRGILVFAKTPAAAKDLNRQLQNGDFGKYYLALTNGIPSDTSGTLENYLYKNPQTNTASVCDAKKKGAKKARLFYEIHNELRDFFTDTSRSTPDTINTNSEDIFFSKNPVNTGDEHASDIQDIFSSSTSSSFLDRLFKTSFFTLNTMEGLAFSSKYSIILFFMPLPPPPHQISLLNHRGPKV